MKATKRPQAIQIFLPTGDSTGIRPGEITTRSVRVFDVPRSELKLIPKESLHSSADQTDGRLDGH